MTGASQRLRVIAGLAATLVVLSVVHGRILALPLLLAVWSAAFWPLSAGELALFAIAALFFTIQNYVCLRAGLFTFRDRDILLMPYYEPLLWGFYLVSMKRFISGVNRPGARLDVWGVVGLAVTSAVFSAFAGDSHALLLGTLCSTALLLVLFHTPVDLSYALFGLSLGLVIELFGVSSGLWSYPKPDVLGLPYWFATMWISVGLLGRRFAIPVAERAAALATAGQSAGE